MRTLTNKWFVTFSLIWLVVYVSRRLGHPIPFVNGYLTDLLAIPVIAQLGLWFQRRFIIKSDGYVLSVWHVVFIFAYVSVVFELILPHFSRKYTADCIDVVLYAIGGVFFYWVMNRPLSSHCAARH